jgi:hypothetical protein
MRDLENVTYRRLAFLLIGIGLVFAVNSIMGLSIIYKLWPILILLPGTGFIGIFLKRKAKRSLYLSVGEYLILFTGLALYCNFTSWTNLAHLWPIFITFLGIVVFSVFLFHRKNRLLLLVGLLLISLSVFFFFVFSIDVHYWWIIFILAGLSILFTCRIK